MNWHKTWKSLQKASPVICTVIGVVGVVGTAILAAKGTPKAIELIKEKQVTKEEPLKPLEKALVAAPAYVPAIGAGAVTIFAIVTSQYLNTKQNLSLAATCTLLQRNFKDYKGKVKELFGDDADQKVVKEISKDRIDPSKIHTRTHPTMDQLYIWFEPNTEQTFEATEAEILKAEMEVNKRIQTAGVCTLAEYCELLKIEIPKGSDDVGWCYDDFIQNWDPDGYWVNFYHEFVDTSEDDLDIPPYYIIHTPISPEWNFVLDERPLPGRLITDEDGCYAWNVR